MAVQVPTGASNYSTASATSANTIVFNKIANTADNDLLVMVGRFQNSGQALSSAGFTVVSSQTTNWSSAVLMKQVTSAASEPATYTLAAASGSGRFVGFLFRVTGAAATNYVDVVGAYSAATGTSSFVAPAITPTKSGGMLLALGVSQLGATGSTIAFSPPAGMTGLGFGSLDSGSVVNQAWAGFEAITSTASTGTRTVGMSPAASNSQIQLISINPGNQAPALGTIANQSVSAGTAVSFTASATDPDGDTVSYAWSVVGAASSASPALTNASTATVSLTAPAAGNLVTLQCMASDPSGASSTRTVELRVPLTGTAEVLPLPFAVTKVGTWTNAGGASTEGGALNDSSDATYLESGAVSGTVQSIMMRLQPTGARSNLTIATRMSTGTDAGTTNVTIELLEGTTVRQTWNQAVSSTSPANYTFTVTNPSAITDGGNLFLRIGAST